MELPLNSFIIASNLSIIVCKVTKKQDIKGLFSLFFVYLQYDT